MDKFAKKVLRDLHVTLLDNVDASTHLLGHLYQERVLEQADVEYVKSAETSAGKTERLLTKLTRCGKTDGFQIFLKGLSDTHPDLVDDMRRKYNKYREAGPQAPSPARHHRLSRQRAVRGVSGGPEEQQGHIWTRTFYFDPSLASQLECATGDPAARGRGVQLTPPSECSWRQTVSSSDSSLGFPSRPTSSSSRLTRTPPVQSPTKYYKFDYTLSTEAGKPQMSYNQATGPTEPSLAELSLLSEHRCHSPTFCQQCNAYPSTSSQAGSLPVTSSQTDVASGSLVVTSSHTWIAPGSFAMTSSCTRCSADVVPETLAVTSSGTGYTPGPLAVTSPSTGVTPGALAVTSPSTGVTPGALAVTSPSTGVTPGALAVTSPSTGVTPGALAVTSPSTGVTPGALAVTSHSTGVTPGALAVASPSTDVASRSLSSQLRSRSFEILVAGDQQAVLAISRASAPPERPSAPPDSVPHWPFAGRAWPPSPEHYAVSLTKNNDGGFGFKLICAVGRERYPGDVDFYVSMVLPGSPAGLTPMQVLDTIQEVDQRPARKFKYFELVRYLQDAQHVRLLLFKDPRRGELHNSPH